MGDRKAQVVGIALLSFGGIGVAAAIYAITVWYFSVWDMIWSSEFIYYLLEWRYPGYFTDYVLVGCFSAAGAVAGVWAIRNCVDADAMLKMLGRIQVWTWALVGAAALLLHVAAVFLNPDFSGTPAAVLYWQRLPSELWPPEDGTLSHFTYALRRLLFDPSPNPAWLLLDFFLSGSFWTLGPLAIGIWAWRGRTSKVIDRIFAGSAFLFAALTLGSVCLLISINWSRLNWEPGPGELWEFTYVAGFETFPFYLNFALMMGTISVLLLLRSFQAAAALSKAKETA